MTTPPAPETAGQTVHDQQVDQRLAGIEQTLAGLSARFHPAAQAHTEARLERPQLIEDQVAAAVRQAQQSQAQEQAAKETASTLADLTAQVSKLKETPPAAAIRPVTALMWGGRRS